MDLLSTDEFAAELPRRLETATRRVSVQLMTFDGDAAGFEVAEALIAAVGRGVRVRLLIDCFALRYVSDERVNRPGVRAEFAATRKLYRRLRHQGVELAFTSPNGPLGIYSLARNHKKLFVIDDHAYLGGINVSDHNYSWHDFMVGLDDSVLVAHIADDFDYSFAGRRQTLDGPILTNTAIEATFDELVTSARDRVVVASPYAIDRHLADLMEQSTATHKTVIVAADNNFRFLELITPYVTGRLAAAGATVATYGRFSHAKFVLADERLLIGSSNYGRHSFWCNQEIGLVIDDAAFVDAFAARMLADLVPAHHGVAPGRRAMGRLASAGMDTFLRFYARAIVPRVPLVAPDTAALIEGP
ncbi:MAG: phosphatidylserine/phosphatidylglycerophosphate/cardiolipin synthase family protein [Actinomycetota bacterium]